MSSAPPPPLALVILAAGASRRLGTCKALVDLGGATPLERLAREGAPLDDLPPLVVSGCHHEAIAAALPPGVELVPNPSWEQGRTGSLAVAARARPGADLVVAPVDVPLVESSVFLALRDAWRSAGSPAAGWLAPASGTPRRRPGHPIVLGRDLALRLPDLPPDTPLKRLRSSARPLWVVDVESPAIHDDLDTPEDLERLRAYSRGQRDPG